MSLPPLSPNAWLRWDVVQRLLPPSADSVLEVGCGQGSLGARLSLGRDYLGVEPDTQSSATARARVAAAGGGGEVRTGVVEEVVEPGRSFDLVCAFEVLEHLEDDAGALASWRGRVRPGGWLLLSTPAFQSRFAAADQMVGHYRRYEPAQLERLLREQGLTDVQVVVYGGPLGHVLEAARNALSRRRLRSAGTPGAAAEPDQDQDQMQQRTHGSGRLFQPPAALGLLTQVGTAPFRVAQRRMPRVGVGLVALARRPGPDESAPGAG